MAAPRFSLTIAAGTLKAAAALACAVSPDRTTVPILGHVLLQAGRDGLSITGTDIDHQAAVRVPADVEGEGAIAVPARTFEDVTAKLPAEAEVILEVDLYTATTALRCGRARFKLPGLPAADFPEFAPAAIGNGFPYRIELAGKVLADVLTRTRFAISTEETRYYLCGVYAHVVEVDGEATLRLVATNGHLLARIDTTHADGLDPMMPGIIIPRRIVPEFIGLAKVADAAPVTLEVSPTLVRLSFGGTVLTSKLIDGTFPDYQRVIPQTFTSEATAPTLALVETLDRVRVMATGKSKGVHLDFRRDTLVVSLRRPSELFEARDELDITLDGEPLAIGFNGKNLAEILAQTGGDTVRIKLGGQEAPAVIGDKLAEALFVLMPVRLIEGVPDADA